MTHFDRVEVLMVRCRKTHQGGYGNSEEEDRAKIVSVADSDADQQPSRNAKAVTARER